MRKLLFILIYFLFHISNVQAQVRIKMQKENGVYTTPCLVNGLKLRFIFDTGASSVSLSLSEAIFMLKNGYLNENDLRGSSYSQLANGQIVENTTINLKELEIGGIKIYNVEANVIHELSAPLLLGQSAIQKLGKIQIEDDELIIMNSDSPSTIVACLKANDYTIKANDYYFDDLYVLAAKTYDDAYRLCPEMIDCFNLHLFASSHYHIENYSQAIKLFNKSISCETNSSVLFWDYLYLGISCRAINDFNQSIFYIQKAITYASDNLSKSFCYKNLSQTYYNQEKYYESIKYAELDIEYYLKHYAITMNDVMRGKLKDEELGAKFWNIGISYSRLMKESESDNFMLKSALSGYEDAIDYCERNDLKYELYID